MNDLPTMRERIAHWADQATARGDAAPVGSVEASRHYRRAGICVDLLYLLRQLEQVEDAKGSEDP